MASYEGFAQLLRQHVRERGWSVSALARRLDLHRSTVNRWINAETRPDTLDLAMTIADLLLLTGRRRELFLRAYGGEAAEPARPAAQYQALSLRQHYIPAPVADFVGRSDELRQLAGELRRALRRNRPASVSICGLGGIGKTELAYALARQLAPLFPDGQILLRMRGASADPLAPEAALQLLLRIFDPLAQLPDELPALRDYYRRVLRQRQVLILADDARDQQQVADLLPPAGSALIVTSRRRFALDGASADLAALCDADAEQLLLSICPRIGAAAGQLSQHCGRLTLALRVSATLLAQDPTYSVARYLQGLEEERARLLYLHDPDNPTLPNVEASLRLSFAALDPSSQLALTQLSVFVAGFDQAAAADVLDPQPDDPAGLAALLEGLYRRSLLDWDELLERYAMHELVRVFCALRLEQPQAIQQRYASHYLEVARRADALYLGGGAELSAGLALFDRERAHIDAGWKWALSSVEQRSATIDQLILGYAQETRFLSGLRYNLRRERIPQLHAALQVALRRQDRQAECDLLCDLGWSYNALYDGVQGAAYSRQSLALARAIGDQRGAALALAYLGYGLVIQGQLEQGIELLEQSLPRLREAGDRRYQGATLSYLGIAYGQLGDLRRAIGYFDQHLSLARALGDRHNESNVLCNLGFAYTSLGDQARAIELCEQAIAIAKETGDRRCEAIACWNLGELLEQQGQLVRAAELMELCVEYEREIGHLDAEKDAVYLDELRGRMA